MKKKTRFKEGLTVGEVRAKVKVSEPTLKKLCDAGVIRCKYIPIGSGEYEVRVIPKSEIPKIEAMKAAHQKGDAFHPAIVRFRRPKK